MEKERMNDVGRILMLEAQINDVSDFRIRLLTDEHAY